MGDAEVGEAHEVDGGGSGGESEVVDGAAAVGDASGLVAVSHAMERSAMGRCRRQRAWVAGRAQRALLACRRRWCASTVTLRPAAEVVQGGRGSCTMPRSGPRRPQPTEPTSPTDPQDPAGTTTPAGGGTQATGIGAPPTGGQPSTPLGPPPKPAAARVAYACACLKDERSWRWLAWALSTRLDANLVRGVMWGPGWQSRHIRGHDRGFDRDTHWLSEMPRSFWDRLSAVSNAER